MVVTADPVVCWIAGWHACRLAPRSGRRPTIRPLADAAEFDGVGTRRGVPAAPPTRGRRCARMSGGTASLSLLHTIMGGVMVFVSSLMREPFGPLREAACSAITLLGCEPARAEDYAASPSSPRVACLAGVRAADAVVLILGAEYGSCQESGLSATHEEYREAREESLPVLAFVEEGVAPEPRQAAFMREVQDWERGHYTASFRDAPDLQDKVIQGLHRLSLDQAATSPDGADLEERARELIPASTYTRGPTLVVAIVGGPARQVIRPADLESADLRRYLQDHAHGGAEAVLSHAFGTDASVRGDTIILEQRDSGARVALGETGSIVVAQPVTRQDSWQSGIPSIIEEEITESLGRALRFGAQVLNHVDPQCRVGHIAIVVALLDAGYLPWRTREEQNRSPHAATMGLSGRDRIEATLSPPTRQRAALSSDTQRLSRDLTVRLRRSRDRDEFLA